VATSHPHLTDQALDAAIIDAAECKASRRHRFDPVGPVPGQPRPQFGSLITYRCERCGTLRFDKVSRLTGERIAPPHYYSPEWYLAADADRNDTAWWRAVYYGTLEPSLFLESEPSNVQAINDKRKRSA
jgi:hypothetical protein